MGKLEKSVLAGAIILVAVLVGFSLLRAEDKSGESRTSIQEAQEEQVNYGALNPKAKAKRREKPSGQVKRITSTGKLGDGPQWSYHVTRDRSSDQLSGDIDGRTYRSQPTRFFGTDRLEVKSDTQPSLAQAQAWARQLLSDDPKNPLRVMEGGRGQQKMVVLSSTRWVATEVRLTPTGLVIDGIYPREVCAMVPSLNRAPDPTYGTAQIACTRSPHPLGPAKDFRKGKTLRREG